MKKYIYFLAPITLLVTFIVFTIMVRTIDMQPLYYLVKAKDGSYQQYIYSVGFWNMNREVYSMSTNLNIEKLGKTISDVILYLSFAYVAGMGGIGVYQWVKRKSLKLVDPHLFVLLGSYVVTVILYFVFEVVKINYAPIWNSLKTSYPSSHVFIASSFYLCSTLTAMEMLSVDRKILKAALIGLSSLVCIVVGFARMLSIQHWFSDILASYILTAFVVTLYHSFKRLLILDKQKEEPVAE